MSDYVVGYKSGVVVSGDLTIVFGISFPLGSPYTYEVNFDNIRLDAISDAPPTPPLSISSAGSYVRVSWPAWATNFVLETSRTLSSADSWTVLTNGITAGPTELVFTNPPTDVSGYYRLRK